VCRSRQAWSLAEKSESDECTQILHHGQMPRGSNLSTL
jgi:hypothetical protein